MKGNFSSEGAAFFEVQIKTANDELCLHVADDYFISAERLA